jgi:hypothetical protein
MSGNVQPASRFAAGACAVRYGQPPFPIVSGTSHSCSINSSRLTPGSFRSVPRLHLLRCNAARPCGCACGCACDSACDCACGSACRLRGSSCRSR